MKKLVLVAPAATIDSLVGLLNGLLKTEDYSKLIVTDAEEGAAPVARRVHHHHRGPRPTWEILSEAFAGSQRFTFDQARVVIGKAGFKRSSASSCISILVAAKYLERLEHGVYRFLKPVPAGVVLRPIAGRPGA